MAKVCLTEHARDTKVMSYMLPKPKLCRESCTSGTTLQLAFCMSDRKLFLLSPHILIIIFAVPSQVTSVSLSKQVISSAPALRVTWDSPQSDVTITRYEVQYRRRSGSPWRSVPSITGSPPPTNTHLESLQAGTSYHVQVRAVSAIGDGGWSDAAMETTYNGEWSANMGQTLAAGVMHE